MNYWNYLSLPNELTEINFLETQVRIIIGENGSGKSTLLSNIAKHNSRTNGKVIAIANTIHDKFNFTNSNFFSLKAASGKYLVKKTIINSIKNLANSDQQTLRFTMLSLGYVGFDQRIGFKIIGFNPNFERLLIETKNLSDRDKKDIISRLYRIQNERINRRDELIWISDIKHSFEELYYSDLIQLFNFERILRREGIITRIDVFLSRNNIILPMLHASSGELTLISSIVFISTVISNKCLILIDEPENSLHPKWQTEYVEKLVDLFHYQNPKIIIATHSPLIINGAELIDANLKIFKMNRDILELQYAEPLNVEEIYSKYFDLITPENRYISEYVIDKLNKLTQKEIDFEKFKQLILELCKNSYDDNQQNVLLEIIEVGRDIITDIQ